MKLRIIVAMMLVGVVLGGCDLFDREAVEMIYKWVPNTTNNGMTHWLPRVLISAEVKPTPDRIDGHTWQIIWGDGTRDQWNGNGYSHRSLDEPWIDPPIYPYGNTRIGITHDYCEPGDYRIEVYYDGRWVGIGLVTVELQESGTSYQYDEDGKPQEVEKQPWESGC